MYDLVGNPEDRFSHNDAHLGSSTNEGVNEVPLKSVISKFLVKNSVISKI